MTGALSVKWSPQAQKPGGGQVVRQLAAGQNGHVVAGVGAGLVQRHRVEGGEHAHIGDDGRVVLGVAVAVGGNVHHQIDVEAGPAVHHRLGVFGDAAVQQLAGRVGGAGDGVEVAAAQAAPAAHALVMVDGSLVRPVKGDGPLGAVLGAGVAPAAQLLVHLGLAGGVLLHLARAAAAAHAQVLDGAAEAGGLVPLEVVQADDDVRVHDGPADLGLLHILAARHRHQRLVGALEAVGDDDLAAGGEGGEPVLIGRLDVLQRVLAAAHIEGVAVGEEGPAALGLDDVRQGLGVVGPQVGQVARLAEMDFDGHEFVLHVDGVQPRRAHQPLQFLQQVQAGLCPQVAVINFCLFHLVLHSLLLCSIC